MMWRLVPGALLLLGCSADTGIMVAVSGQPVDELEFQVALSRGTQYVIDPEISGQRFGVAGRDLRGSPYELLLREEQPDEGDPPTVRVLALGHQGTELRSFALMEPPQIFVRGELLRRALLLQAIGTGATATRAGRGCYTVQASSKTYQLVLATDRDCDGYGPDDAPPDCDDASPLINPKAAEICDGKDNNCDGRLSSAGEACYATGLSGECRQGVRNCVETPTGGTLGECNAEGGPEVAAPYCFVYAACQPPALLTCLGSRLLKQTYSCTLEAVDGAGGCYVERAIPALFSSKKCRWVLTSTGGLPVILKDANGALATGEPPTIYTCTGKLFIEKGSLAGGTVTLEAYDDEGKKAAVFQLNIGRKLVPGCTTSALACAKAA